MPNNYVQKEPHEDVENLYFLWLCGKITKGHLIRKYLILLRALYKKEFYWSVPNDDNRGVDGRKLRTLFSADAGVFIKRGPCSFLEMMIALAERCEDVMAEPETKNQTPRWFWEMIDNLGLTKFTDEAFVENGDELAIDAILTRVLDRTYDKNGKGGLFPLINANKDQRTVEIWYQMSAYLLENYYHGTAE